MIMYVYVYVLVGRAEDDSEAEEILGVYLKEEDAKKAAEEDPTFYCRVLRRELF